MKRLFCTVVTDFDGTLDSPIIFHIKAITMEKAEECAREQLVEYGYEDSELDDLFETFTFEVGEADIIEA
jgi:hypothetical protein